MSSMNCKIIQVRKNIPRTLKHMKFTHNDMPVIYTQLHAYSCANLYMLSTLFIFWGFVDRVKMPTYAWGRFA